MFCGGRAVDHKSISVVWRNRINLILAYVSSSLLDDIVLIWGTGDDADDSELKCKMAKCLIGLIVRRIARAAESRWGTLYKAGIRVCGGLCEPGTMVDCGIRHTNTMGLHDPHTHTAINTTCPRHTVLLPMQSEMHGGATHGTWAAYPHLRQ